MSKFRCFAVLAISLTSLALAARVSMPSLAQSAQKAAPPSRTGDTQPVDLAALIRQVSELFKAGKYAEAIPLATRMTAEVERIGGGRHPLQAQNFVMLGDLHRLGGNFAEAETHLTRALTLIEEIQGKQHPDVAASLLSLHHLRVAQGRYKDAAVYLNRAVKIREAALKPDDPELSWTRVTQAKLAHTVGRPDLAAGLLQDALEVFRTKLPPGHPYTATTTNNLSQALVALGRLNEAEPLLERAVRETAQIAGANSPLAATALNNLALLYRLQGRLLEAEDLHRRELQIAEAALGPESLGIVPSLNNLALALDALQRPREAEPLLRRALALQRKSLAANHPEIATTTSNLATIVGQDGRRDEARTLLEQSITMREAAFGPRSSEVASSLQNLSTLLLEAKRNEEALKHAERALAINEAVLPAGHPSLATGRNNVGVALDVLGRHAQATAFIERALKDREAALGAAHPDTILTSMNLAANALDLGNWQGAYDLATRAGDLYERTFGDIASSASGKEASDGTLARIRGAFLVRAAAAERLRETRATDADALTADAFVALQREQLTATGSALRAASLRAAGGQAELARVVRERQDIAEQWHARNTLLIEALGRPQSERDPQSEAAMREEVATLATLAKALDTRLAREFPAYATLVKPTPLPLAEAQRKLGDTDALILISPTHRGALVFGITRQGARLVRSNLTGADIERMVARLRCGLDATLWASEPSRGTCAAHGEPRAPGVLPFDLATAHALYAGLLKPIETLIAGKRLKVVTSGPLTTLPLHVLVTTPPAAGADWAAAMRQASWLAQRHAISVLPSVDSLGRSTPSERMGRASKPYLAIANPLLAGPDGLDRRAYDRQTCRAAASAAAPTAPDTRAVKQRAVPRPSLDIESLRRQMPLPETADEVCAVAKLLGAGEDDVLLGSRASLSQIKAMAGRDALAHYRVLHIASHGLVAGGSSTLEKALPEPAILLTPPPPGTTGAQLAQDNGLLAASDIAALKLNADWVVLSACNTAAGGRTNAEPLSGLARAFFYAGARGLLVSHWEVYSEAAVRLVTRAFETWSAAPARGRSGALAAAMSELLASADPLVSHPAYWAPFVVVGAD